MQFNTVGRQNMSLLTCQAISKPVIPCQKTWHREGAERGREPRRRHVKYTTCRRHNIACYESLAVLPLNKGKCHKKIITTTTTRTTSKLKLL